jgi:hypothetical protein
MRLSYLRCCAISAGPPPFAWDADETGFRSFADFRCLAFFKMFVESEIHDACHVSHVVRLLSGMPPACHTDSTIEKHS